MTKSSNLAHDLKRLDQIDDDLLAMEWEGKVDSHKERQLKREYRKLKKQVKQAEAFYGKEK